MTTIPDHHNPTRARGNPLIQTWALAVDAYREINSKKLFWITLILSALVVGVVAFVGINPTGFSIFWIDIPHRVLNSNFISPGQFYTFIFFQFAVPIWLTWAATILALISTSSQFPDLLTSGSIELYLSKPITRFRLFLTKYIFGLLFAAVQVLVFCVCAVLLIGIRGGEWQPRIFLAVPILTLFFSFLFCVSVFVGVLTRSTLAAILLTILFWFVLWIANSAEGALQLFRIAQEQEVARIEQVNEARKSHWIDLSTTDTPEQLDEAKQTLKTLKRWEGVVFGVRWGLPKTNETIELLNRAVVTNNPLIDAAREDASQRQAQPIVPSTQESPRERGRRQNQKMEDASVQQLAERSKRGVWYVLGTSLAFEAIVLGIAGWIFCRRDY